MAFVLFRKGGSIYIHAKLGACTTKSTICLKYQVALLIRVVEVGESQAHCRDFSLFLCVLMYQSHEDPMQTDLCGVSKGPVL